MACVWPHVPLSAVQVIIHDEFSRCVKKSLETGTKIRSNLVSNSPTILISCKFLEIKNYSSFGKGVSSAISTRNCWEMVTAKNTEIDSRIMLRAGYKFIANRIVREISLVYITRGKQSNVQLKQI